MKSQEKESVIKKESTHIDLIVMTGILLVAFLFRFHQLNDVPPGPSHDELRMIQLGEMIVQGARPIHWTVSYSAEPLFHYLLALIMPLLGYTPFAARIVTRFSGIILIPLTYVLAHRLYGRRVALLSSFVLAITWWPIFFGRVALRGITLPTILTFAGYAVYRGFYPLTENSRKATSMSWTVLGGFAMGVSWYSFTAARGFIILFPLFTAFVAISDHRRRSMRIRAGIIASAISILLIIPFIGDTILHPGAPESRIDQLGEIITEFRTGNLAPLFRQTIGTAGMFLFKGDPNWRYNIADVPAFGYLLGAVTMVGIILTLIQFREPRSMFIVLWLVIGWAPSMLTPEAPSFVRGIGAMTPAVIAAGRGASLIWRWGQRAFEGSSLRIAVGPILLLGFVVIGSTWNNLFNIWPNAPEVREIYQASLTEAVRALNDSDLEGKIWVAEPFPDDRHLMLAERLLERPLKLRWYDGQRSLVLPPVEGERIYLLADFSESDPTLTARWIREPNLLLTGHSNSFRVIGIAGGTWVEKEIDQIIEKSMICLDAECIELATLPVEFGGKVSMLGYEFDRDNNQPGATRLVVYWKGNGPVYEPLSSFAHLLNSEGNIIAQYDGFDVPPRRWTTGILFAQIYQLRVDSLAPDQTLPISVGVYYLETMSRLSVLDKDERVVSDRVWIGSSPFIR